MESTDLVGVELYSDAAGRSDRTVRDPSESFEDDGHDAKLPEFQPLRGITLEHVDQFVNVEVPQMLGLVSINGRFRILSNVDRVTLDDALVATITTTVEHRLYKFDQVAINDVVGRSADTLLNGRSFTVSCVKSPTEFQIQLRDVCTDFTSGCGGTVVTPVNMYKACPEVVIPATTTAECLVRINSKETLAALRRAVVDPSSNLTLSISLVLPDAHGNERLVRKGLTVHGRLSPLGCVRRRYWSRGSERHHLWRTPERWRLPARAVCGAPVDTLPANTGGLGEREDKLWNLDSVEVDDILVLRTGVAYAELFDDGNVDDFVSHWWGEESHDLVVSLWNHEDDWMARQPPGGEPRPGPGGHVRGRRRKYVCTLVNRQHCVVLGTWDDWESFIFNVVLRHVGACGGSVVLGLDGMAMPLTRIWCIFEAWVSASHGIKYLLYTVHGELHKCMQSAVPEVSKLARSLQDKVGELDLRDAQSTQEEDRQNIMHLIEDSQGGVDRVECMVKNTILNTQTIMTNMQRVKDPMTGKLLRIEGDKPEILPTRARLKEFGLHGFIRDSCRRHGSFAAEDLYRRIRDRGERVLIAAPGGAGKTSLTVELARLAARAEGRQAAAARRTCMRVPLSQLGGLVTAWVAALESATKARIVAPEINDPLVDWAEARFGPKYSELLEPAEHAGLLLILDALDESSDPNAVLFWLKHWTSQRQKSGWKDDLIITTRPETLVLHVRVRLRAMFFETYELALLAKQEAMEIVSRIAGPLSALKVERLTPALYERPLMATLVAHYFAGLSSQRSGSSGSLPRTQSATVSDTTESVVLDFMRRRFIEQAVHASRLQRKDVSLALGHLAFTATAQCPDANSYLHTRARTRLLNLSRFEQACAVAELDADSVDRLFKLARRGELRVLEPVNDGQSVQFMHLLVQDYFTACFLYEGPGDVQPFKDCWRSISELSAAKADGLGPLREHLIGLIASGSPRGGDLPFPRQPEYFSYTSLCWMQICAVQGGPHAPDAVARTVSVAGKDKWSVGFAMDRAQNAKQQRKTIAALAREADMFDMALFIAAATSNAVGPLAHPGWLLLAFYSIAWRSSGSYFTYQFCSAVSGLAGLLSLGLNLETMNNPFTVMSAMFWGIPCWTFLSVYNFACLPAVFLMLPLMLLLPLLQNTVVGLLRSLGLMRVVCGNFYPIRGAPLDSKTVRFLGRRAPRAVQLFLFLGNVAAIVGLVW